MPAGTPTPSSNAACKIFVKISNLIFYCFFEGCVGAGRQSALYQYIVIAVYISELCITSTLKLTLNFDIHRAY